MATIIKAATDARYASATEIRAAALDLTDLSSKADEYLKAVRLEASKIVQEAHRQAEGIRREAEAAGQQAAKEAAGRVLDQKVAQRMQTILPALQQLIDQLREQRADWYRLCEVTLVRLAIGIAERVIRRQVQECPEIPVQWIHEGLELATGAASVSVRLHPQDVEGLGSQIDRLTAELGRFGSTQIVADSGIAPGGCVVQTEFGTVDMQLDAQLARIEEELCG